MVVLAFSFYLSREERLVLGTPLFDYSFDETHPLI